MGITDIKKYAVHEVIHHLQEVKDDETLIRMGLCTYGAKTNGMALNEAAVQIISSYVLSTTPEQVKYYGINLTTISPDFYPLQCNLMSQMCYLIGENIMYDSTFFSNDTFKNQLIKYIGKKNYTTIELGFEEMLDCEEQLVIIANKLSDPSCDEKDSKKYANLVKTYKDRIKRTFFHVQNSIFVPYFETKYTQLQTDNDIQTFKRNLSVYKELIGTSDDYNAFNDYYMSILRKIDLEYENIVKTSLVTHKENRFINLIKKLLHR